MIDPRCGTTAGYQAHGAAKTTACGPCRQAQADWQRHYRTRLYLAKGPLLVDGTGTRRRLQALARLGWGFTDVARELGVSGSAVSNWTRSPRVRRSTVALVSALYDRWSLTIGPNRKSAGKARIQGWPPPLAWDDDEIDDPAASPVFAPDRHVGPGPGRDMEREERVMELTRAGVSAARIADRLHVTERYVGRVRARNRDERQEKSA
jgi:hypothetical protein